jgi:hypothetical protein
MSAKKDPGQKHVQLNITVRPDQLQKALRLQSQKRLSAVCQAAIDAES